MKTKYFAFAAIATLLASCSNDEDFTPQVDSLKDTPITVTAGVDAMKSRAGHDADNLPATFYLTVTQTDEVSQYNYTNVEMKKGSDNNYTPSTDLLWMDNTRSPFVSAYTIEGTTFTVQADQSTAESVITSDLLGAVKERGNTSEDIAINDNNINIRFRHLLCKLDVTFSWGSELMVETITDKSIKSVKYVGFGSKVTLNRTTATVEASDATAEINAYLGTMTSEAVFAPRSATPKIVIMALIDNVERVFTVNVTAPAEGFVSGNRYTMNVTIGGTATETGEISIAKGWGDTITGDDMQTM